MLLTGPTGGTDANLTPKRKRRQAPLVASAAAAYTGVFCLQLRQIEFLAAHQCGATGTFRVRPHVALVRRVAAPFPNPAPDSPQHNLYVATGFRVCTYKP